MDAIELKILIGLHRVSNEIDRRTTRIVKCYGLSMGQFAVLESAFSQRRSDHRTSSGKDSQYKRDHSSYYKKSGKKGTSDSSA